MIDQHFDRQYQAGRAELNDGVDHLLNRLAREARVVSEAVHRFQFSAPWTDPRSR